MKHLSEDQQYLLLGKISGSLSMEEEVRWEALAQTNPSILNDYEELLKELPTDEVADSFSQIKKEETWSDLADKYRLKRESKPVLERIPYYKKLSIAAVIIGLFICLGIIWKQKSNDPLAIIAQKYDSKNVELKTASGQLINLSMEQGMINYNNIQYNNTNKTLTYSYDKHIVNQSENNHLTVPQGLDYKIKLNDGTEVWLNAESYIDFPTAFVGKAREIYIKGEAYIKVARKFDQPFIVHLPGSLVEVLGTEFNVNTYDSGIVKVSLVEGSVNMKSETTAKNLLPGKEAICKNGKLIEERDFNARLVLSWREGIFYFKGTTLSEISKVVARWFGVKTVIDNPSIDGREFVGALDRNKPIQVFLDNLKAISKIDSYFDKDKVLHFK
jgi:transmembrane sensor